MEVTRFSDHGNQGCQSDAPWRKIEKKSPGGDPKWQPFREFRSGGICWGSTAWIISCGRRWWKHVTLALYLIYKKAEREKTMGWHSMAMKITSFFWCFYWGLVLGQPFQSILRSTETNGCSSCVSWPGAGNFNRKFSIKLRLHSGNSTGNL